tara:strand:+ start:19 stop:864 length:846 start_codon:yes stop_codon:yes gene_type:complete
MREDVIKSFAKINLSLGVLGKYNKNLHRIETLVSFIDLNDQIKIKKIEQANHRVMFQGKFSKKIYKNNTVTELLNILDKQHLINNQKYQIIINKKIPSKAGLGGGSMNASAILNYLLKKNKKTISEKKLAQICNKIGSDVILGLKKKNSILLGNGKLIRSQSKLKLYTLILKPSFGCSTKELYKEIKHYSRPLLNKNSKIFTINKLSNLSNDLEIVAFKKYPILRRIKDRMQVLPKVSFVKMTGSGSCMVAFFRTKKASLNAAKILKKKYKNYWCILSKTI